jgi:hypothetical protein
VNTIEQIRHDAEAYLASKQNDGSIRNEAIRDYAEKIVRERAEMLVWAMNAYSAITDQIAKIQPDQKSFPADGGPPIVSFSQGKYTEKTKAEQKLSQLELSVSAAVHRADYESLKKFKASFGGGKESEAKA